MADFFGGGGGNPSPRLSLQVEPAPAATDVRRHISRNPAVAPAGSLPASRTKKPRAARRQPFFWWRWRESPLQGAPTPACVGRSHGTRHEAVHVACPFEPRVPRVLFPQAAPNTKGCPKAARRFFGGGGGNRPCRARPRLHAWAALTAHDMKQFMSRVRSSPASRGFSSRKPHQKTTGYPKAALGFFGGGGGNRTRVRKPYTARTTCLARSFESRLAPAGRQADAQPVASTDPRGQATKLRREADVNDAAPSNRLGLRLASPSA